MMNEQRLSDAIGIDKAAEDALNRAGVRTVKEFLDAESEALAANSGIPSERIREWQQRARKMSSRRGMSALAKAWVIGVVAILIAVLLGWALMAIGSRRIQRAEQIRVAAESKLDIALAFAAEEAIDELRQARLALHNKNWGSAQSVLSSVEDKVTFMERVASATRKREIGRVREQIGELQRSVSEEAEDTMERLDALEASLDAARMTQ